MATQVRSECMWVRRTAIIMQLKKRQRTQTDVLAHCVQACAHEKVGRRGGSPGYRHVAGGEGKGGGHLLAWPLLGD